MTKLAVVIAAYDEEENIEPLTRRLDRALRTIPDCSWEILYVVEGRDRTREILERLKAELPQIRILYQEEPSGLGNAFRLGFAAVGPDADYVVTLDADLNHQPEEIPGLLAALERRGADVLVGSRFLAASEVEGIPVWKRFLSGTMNVLMRYLYGVRVLDKTSGFRVYRAAALRTLRFENENFAFLPELLIRAHAAGFRIVEEPIHFIFRVRGSSKMRFWRTSLSYLSLLRSRFDRWSVAALALLLVGIAALAVAIFPIYKYPGDADCLRTGLCALRVLRGETPVFFSGVRIGSIECHTAAALFALFGASRLSLGLTAFATGVLALLVAYWFYRGLLGRRLACFALPFLALPPPALLFWASMPNGYPTILLLCAAILGSAVWMARTGASGARSLGFGLLAGLGFWQSFLTLSCSVPAALWLAARRPELGRRWRLGGIAAMAGMAGLGFLLGAAPWLAYNLRYPLASFQGNFASRTAGLGAMRENVAYLLTYSLPELAASTAPEGSVVPGPPLLDRLRPAVLVIAGAAVLLFLLLPWVRKRWSGGGVLRDVEGGAWWLCLGVALVVAALNVFSEAGTVRGLTVRYLLPLFLLLPAALGLLVATVASIGRWGRAAAALVALAVLAFNLTGYRWPWNPRRAQLTAAAREDERLVAGLERRGIGAVLGSFWIVYPIAFLSGERIVGIPCEPGLDFYPNVEKLAAARWAIVAGNRFRQPFAQWIADAGLQGSLETSEPYAIFLPRGDPGDSGAPGETSLERVRAICTNVPGGP